MYAVCVAGVNVGISAGGKTAADVAKDNGRPDLAAMLDVYAAIWPVESPRKLGWV